MSEIQSLALRVEELSRSVDWWNKAMILALVFAAIAAIAVVLTTRIALTRAKELADAQGRLLDAKDKQLTLDLKDKDLKIAEAGGKAATAETKAEGFRLDIAKAKEGASLAEQHAAEANQKAEQERLARVKIEERLAGWRLEPEAQARLAEKLKPFAKTPFDLSVNPVEAKFMEIMDDILAKAGWSRQEPKVLPTRPGVLTMPILVNGKAGMSSASGINVELAQESLKQFEPAAATLVKGLIAEGIPVTAIARTKDTDPSAIHIVIGNKE